MKRVFITFTLTLVLWLTAPVAYAAQHFVTVHTDEQVEGTLRVVLQRACDEAGDDTISFAPPQNVSNVKVNLHSPLLIPQDCQGTVYIEGSADVDLIYSGAAFNGGGEVAGDSCIINVYTDGNTVENLSFVDNSQGAGICFFGQNNRITGCRLGADVSGSAGPNRYGVVVSPVFSEEYPDMDATGSEIAFNYIRQNERFGVLADADDMTITGNEITDNGADGIWIRTMNSSISANIIERNGACVDILQSTGGECLEWVDEGYGVGVFIEEGSSAIVVGGDDISRDSNNIQFNANGGVWVMGAETQAVTITHNIISQNYGSGLQIDLGVDGVSLNDALDGDQGTNTLLNYMESFQTFSLVPDNGGGERYWGFGLAPFAERVEIYEAAISDYEAGILHGGGDKYMGDMHPVNSTFQILPTTYNFETGAVVTGLSFDDLGNTSEFAVNVEVGADADLDGILDQYEIGDGTEISEGTDPAVVDSDADGLPDSVEDKNKNGIWEIDRLETSAYKADSDDDGVSDWHEIRGDGYYREGFDTNPLDADTDDDGLTDGEEDTNGNGRWEAYLNETSPLLRDSDEDGFADGSDTCPAVYNPGQESWYCDY